MRFILRAIFGLIMLAGALYAVGTTMPREHAVKSRINLIASPDSVFNVLRAFGDYPSWDSDFKSSVRGKSRTGRETWVQEVSGMTLRFEVKEVNAPRKVVTEMVTDERSMWGGVWTYEIKSTGAGTEVTISEEGWIQMPPLRVLMKVMGTHRSVDGVLKSLAARFGEMVTPTHER
jgi:hypothetical protein